MHRRRPRSPPRGGVHEVRVRRFHMRASRRGPRTHNTLTAPLPPQSAREGLGGRVGTPNPTMGAESLSSLAQRPTPATFLGRGRRRPLRLGAPLPRPGGSVRTFDDLYGVTAAARKAAYSRFSGAVGAGRGRGMRLDGESRLGGGKEMRTLSALDPDGFQPRAYGQGDSPALYTSRLRSFF